MLDLGFTRPFPPGHKAVIGSGWWRPRDGDRVHPAADLFAEAGTPIIAVAPGRVIRLQATPSGAAGVWVGLEHDRKVVTRYMHMSRVAPGLALGQLVRRGQLIGYVGSTGTSSTGPHLHFDIKAPADVLPLVQMSVGKPTTGWYPMQEPWGYGIPAEPWLPVDAYTPRTIADATRYGIPLYNDRVSTLGTLVKVGLAGFVVWGVVQLARRRRLPAFIG